MFETSTEIATLLEALSAFQGVVTAPKKTSTNPHFKSKYADLAEVIEAIRAPLAANGLSYYQAPIGMVEGAAIKVVTQVSHKSGQWIRTTFAMPVGQATAQAVGTAISYARRYALQAALGLAAEDDDGYEATKAPERRDVTHAQARGGERAASRPTSAQTSTETETAASGAKAAAAGTELATNATAHHSDTSEMDADPTEEQKVKIRSLAKTLGIQNQVQLSDLMMKLVGKVAADITSADAQTLIAKMGQRAIDKAEGRV